MESFSWSSLLLLLLLHHLFHLLQRMSWHYSCLTVIQVYIFHSMSSIISSLSDDENLGPSHEERSDDTANTSALIPPRVGGNILHERTSARRLLSEDENGLGEPPRPREKQVDSKAGERPHTEKPSLLQDWWIWEILAVILSLATTAATIIILAVYDGHPLPSWPYQITLNAVISVLSTVAKVGPL